MDDVSIQLLGTVRLTYCPSQVFKQEAYEQLFLEQIEKLKASKGRAMNGNS